jgi:hypothetical protein
VDERDGDAGVDGETPPTVDATGNDPVRLVDAAALATRSTRRIVPEDRRSVAR